MLRCAIRGAAALAVLALVACDRAAPPVPFLDPVPSPTSLEWVTVSGVAEPKANLLISRTPAFTDPPEPETVTAWKADPVSGRFAFKAPLMLETGQASTVNLLQVVAQDAKGNKSKPAVLEVVREARRPEGLVVTLADADISADEGRLVVSVSAVNNEAAVPLGGLAVSVTVTGYTPAPAAVSGTTDDAGHAVIVVEGLTTVGSGRVAVDAAQAGPAGATHAEAPFMVHAGAPATVDLKLATAGGTAADTLSVPAGTDVTLVLDVKDAHQNAVGNADITLWSEVPGSVVSGLTLLQVKAAGSWLITATSPIPAAADSATLTVTPGAPDRMELTLSSTQLAAGDTLVAEVRMYDALDNLVAPTTAPAVDSGLPTWHPGQADEDLQTFTVTTSGPVITGTVVPKTAGAYTAVASTGPGGISAAVDYEVRPGAPASVAVTAAPNPLTAGQDLTVTTVVADAFGNLTAAPVDIWTSAPGALVVGHVIQRITRASGATPYTVSAAARDTSIVGSTDLVVVPAAGSRLVTQALPPSAAAGATVTITAHVEDAYGNILTAETPTLSASLGNDNLGAAQALSAVTVTGGVASATVTLNRADRYTISSAGGGFTGGVDLVITPGAPDPAGFAFDLGAPPLGGFLVGQPVPFTYAVLDSFLNETGRAIVVTINAPNAFVVDNGDGNGTINGIVRAGNYTASARVPGTGIATLTEPLVLSPDPGQGFNLTLSASLAAQGGSILAFVQDAFGNELSIAGITFSGLDPSVSQSGNRLTFSQQGSFAITACLAAAPTTCDTEYVGVQGSVDVTPPSVTVTVSYPVSSSVVPANGRVSFAVNATDDRALSQISYVAQFGIGGSCTRAGGPVLLPAGTLTTTPPLAFTFTVPGCALPLDRISIVARAMDAAGNANNSAENTQLSVASRYNLTPSTGFLTQLLAYGNNLNQCEDGVREAGNDRVVISNRGDDRAYAIYADRTIARVQDSNGNNLTVQQQPKGVEYDPINGRVLFALEQNSRIAALDALGNYTSDFIRTTANGGIMHNGIPEGLTYDNGTLCIAFPATRTFQCITLGTTAGATPASRCITTDATNLQTPGHIALRGTDIWVSDRGNRNLHHYTLGATTCTFVGTLTPATPINQPADILIAPVTGNLIVSDRNNANGNGSLLRVNATNGLVSTVVSGFDTPNGLAWDGNGVLVVDEGRTINEAVFLVSPDPAAPGVF